MNKRNVMRLLAMGASAYGAHRRSSRRGATGSRTTNAASLFGNGSNGGVGVGRGSGSQSRVAVRSRPRNSGGGLMSTLGRMLGR